MAQGNLGSYDLPHSFLAWGAVRIIETPGWGKLNLNRSVAYDE